MKISLVRTFSGFKPATPQDVDQIKRVRIADVITAEVKRVRNPRFHRKFFALLNLAYQYWCPDVRLILPVEHRITKSLIKLMRDSGVSDEALTELQRAFYSQLNSERREIVMEAGKSFEAFREWVTVESGYYVTVLTPRGIERRAKSISFAAMNEPEFQDLYKAVFSVCWEFLADNFRNEAEAEAAAMQLWSLA